MARGKPPPLINKDNGKLTLHHLSYSSLSTFEECMFKFFLIYVLGYRRPPAWYLPVGSAGHAALEENNNNYIDKGSYMEVHDLEEYGRLSLKSLIVTKLDESRCIGGFLDAILAHPVPLSWVTTGQDIPRDIHTASKKMFFDRMMEA